MVDFLSPSERSARMAAIRSRNTRPELVVRRMLHELGYRFRLHVKGIPGRPDIVFSRKRKVIFVHGCFWHWHRCQKRPLEALPPLWQAKIERNRKRDSTTIQRVEAEGWAAIVIWECETKNASRSELRMRLTGFLGPPRSAPSNVLSSGPETDLATFLPAPIGRAGFTTRPP